MSIPTTGETFAKLIENLRYAQENAAMMAHLIRAQDDTELAIKWLAVSEQFKHMQHTLTQLAIRRTQ